MRFLTSSEVQSSFIIEIRVSYCWLSINVMYSKTSMPELLDTFGDSMLQCQSYFRKLIKTSLETKLGPPGNRTGIDLDRERFPLKMTDFEGINARFWPLHRRWLKHPNPSNWIESPQCFEGKNMEKQLKLYHQVPPPFCPENLVMREAPVRAPHHVSPLRSNSMGLYTPGAWWTLPLVPFCFVVVESWNYFRCDTDGKWNKKGWPKFWIITLGLASSEKQVQLQWSSYKNYQAEDH